MNNFKYSVVLILLALWGCNSQPANKPAEPGIKPVGPVKAKVFITAKDTALRLTQMPDALFEPFGQPFETQVCVFVDPAKTFQTMIGIGGALTDASGSFFKTS